MICTIKVSSLMQHFSSAQMVCYFVSEDTFVEDIKKIDLDFTFLESICSAYSFEGKDDTVALFPVKKEQNKIQFYCLLGLGKKNNKGVLSFEFYRRALGNLITSVASKKVTSVFFSLCEGSLFGVKDTYVAQQTSEILHIASYVFNTYIPEEKSDKKEVQISLFVPKEKENEIVEHLKNGDIAGFFVNQARDWIDTPPSDLTPEQLAEKAASVAKDANLKCTIFDKEKIISLGMNGLYGVSRGSKQDPRFVILEYFCGDKNAPTIGFVGKGITFDSGGLSLKPAVHMETMKDDMAGAASVINALGAIGSLQPKHVNVIGFAALTENMPGPDALKPGDIITFYNGKTAEVKNTDAEGRLILADALAYAVKNYTLNAIIDVATLTGACIYAVGPFFSALLSDNDDLANKINEQGVLSGDAVWRLPFTSDFKKAISSKIANMQNIESRSICAGTITAACFLRNFVDSTPWAHIDIASTAFQVPNISYYRNSGATGSSVRLLLSIALHW